MKYFLDTEFIESAERKTIDLISIGIVSEDGRKYYAISNEFDPEKASDWVTENVLSKLPPKPGIFNPAEASIRELSESKAWKSREQIKQELLDFITPDEKGIEFWAGWAAYDWVVFCWIFGCMIDLPDGFPYYCNDVIQWLNQLGLTRDFLPPEPENAHNALDDAQWVKDAYKILERYSVENKKSETEIFTYDYHDLEIFPKESYPSMYNYKGAYIARFGAETKEELKNQFISYINATKTR